jgi:hypothetical protein
VAGTIARLNADRFAAALIKLNSVPKKWPLSDHLVDKRIGPVRALAPVRVPGHQQAPSK